MNTIKTQVKTQYDYVQAHKGKAIGSAIGILAGLSYGMVGKKDTWVIVGLTMAGMVLGVVAGAYFDPEPEVVVISDTDAVKSNIGGARFGRKFSACPRPLCNGICCGAGKICSDGFCV